MRRYYILFVIIVLISCDSANQFESPEESYFVKFYGDDGNHEGVDFIANSDGTFILLGNEEIAGQKQQIYLVKVDAQGMVIGEPKSFGSIDVDDFAKDIEVTPNGNIIVAAESQTGPDNRDVYILIVDTNLNLINEKTVSGVLQTTSGQEADEEVNSISIISDGFIVAGSTTAVGLRPSVPPVPIKLTDIRDGLHLRFNSNLELIVQSTGNWFYTTGRNDGEDVLVKMIEISPSLYYGFGYTNTPLPVNNNARNFKYWAFSIGSTAIPAGYDEIFISGNSVENRILNDVIKSPSSFGDGYVLGGIKSNSIGESQSYIVKLGQPLVQGQNNVLYEESPTDLGSDVGSKTSITGLAQGGYYLLNNSKLPPSDNIDISINKLSNSFRMEGRESIYFGGEGDDFTGAIKELPDGKIMAMGTMTLGGVSGQRKIVLMKLNKDGKLVE